MLRQFLPCPFSSLLKGKYISNIVINSHLYQRDCDIWRHLRINLHLNECPELNSSPENIQHLTSLRSLCIWDCEGLASLPINQIGYLTSLSHLEIGYCPNLESLPDGVQSLSNLSWLTIRNCSTLKKRCKKKGGEDWPKIAHIPRFEIF
jgi:hypothetical protein